MKPITKIFKPILITIKFFIPLYIFWVLLFILLVALYILFFTNIVNDEITTILGGLISGCIILLFHIYFERNSLKSMEIVKNSKIEDVLDNRDNENYYQVHLSNVRKELKVMGSSCTRLLDDFGSRDTKKPSVFKDLLDRGVQIQLLVYNDTITQQGADGNNRFNVHNSHKNFTIKLFSTQNFIPQSIFIIDNKCILGPIFTGKKSKDTVALSFSDSSVYTKQYSEYFDKVWKDKDSTILE